MSTHALALIEDDPAFNELLSLYLNNDEEINLVATGSNGQEAIDIANRLHPEVFLMDLNMPVMDGLEATRQILAAHPDIKIIAITTFDSYEYVSQALALGVHGYLMKNSRVKEIKQAITAAVEGRAIIDRRALASLVISMNLTQPPQGDPWSELNTTEQAITKLVCRGYTNQEIAQELNYSLSNVKNTLTRVYQKMGVTTRTQLLVHAGHHNFPVLDD